MSEKQQEMAENGRLSAKQEKALLALLSAPTIHAAAQSAGIGERTLFTWLKDPAFCTAYRQDRREAVTQATARLQHASSAAVTTLQDIMNDTEAPAPARVTAARVVLDLSIKSVELEDLVARIEALESQQPEKGPAR